MTKRMEEILEVLDASGSSAASAVAVHLSTVAENGAAYATDKSLLYEAQALRQYAQMVIDEIQ